MLMPRLYRERRTGAPLAQEPWRLHKNSPKNGGYCAKTGYPRLSNGTQAQRAVRLECNCVGEKMLSRNWGNRPAAASKSGATTKGYKTLHFHDQGREIAAPVRRRVTSQQPADTKSPAGR